jgi:hypothetical protein
MHAVQKTHGEHMDQTDPIRDVLRVKLRMRERPFGVVRLPEASERRLSEVRRATGWPRVSSKR